MTRAIVYVKGKNWENTGKTLALISIGQDNSLVNEYGTVLEFYLESFGNPDFIIVLWAKNIELLKSAIVYIRKVCDAETTSIIGVEPTERSNVETELKNQVKNKASELTIKNIINCYLEQERNRLKMLENGLE